MLRDDYESLHFVDRVSKIYAKIYKNEDEDTIKWKLLQALNFPTEINEVEDEEND